MLREEMIELITTDNTDDCKISDQNHGWTNLLGQTKRLRPNKQSEVTTPRKIGGRERERRQCHPFIIVSSWQAGFHAVCQHFTERSPPSLLLILIPARKKRRIFHLIKPQIWNCHKKCWSNNIYSGYFQQYLLVNVVTTLQEKKTLHVLKF